MNPPPNAAASRSPKRTWFRFSLRTFLLLTIVVGGICGWLASVLARVQHQREIVKLVQASGGSVNYPHEGVYAEVDSVSLGFSATADHTRRLRELSKLRAITVGVEVDDEMMAHFASVPSLEQLTLSGVKDADVLVHLQSLAELKSLMLFGSSFQNDELKSLPTLVSLRQLDLRDTGITSKGLQHLSKMPNLQGLTLYGCVGVDDDGLQEIAKLTQLWGLSLYGTATADAGLVHLQKLRELRVLDLRQTRVTDVGLRNLAGLKYLRNLSIDDLKADSGLSALVDLPALEVLELLDCALTDDGLKSIGHLKNLRILKAYSTKNGEESPFRVTDEGLLQLAALSKLEEAWIDGNITPEGTMQLHSRLPKCQIHGGSRNGLNRFKIP